MKKEKITKRDIQAQETRARIFDTAFRLIVKNGFDNVTVDDICRESGIAKGLFYYYFKSKADIVIETYTIIDKDFKEDLAALPADITPVEKIIFTVNTQARYGKQRGVDFVRQIYKSQIDTGTAFFIASQRPFYQTINESVIEGQKEGKIRSDITSDEFTRYILSVSRGILYDWCLHNGDYDIEAAVENCFRKIIFP